MLLLGLTLGGGQLVSAGLFTQLLSDIGPDQLTDYSWSFSPNWDNENGVPGDPKKGDIIVGVARLHKVNGTPTTPPNQSSDGWESLAWVVFAFQIEQIITESGVTTLKHGPVTNDEYNDYKLKNLLGESGLDDNAMIALLELAEPIGSSQYLQDDHYGTPNNISKVISDLAKDGTWIATFGKKDSVGSVEVEISRSGGIEFINLLLLDSNPALPLVWHPIVDTWEMVDNKTKGGSGYLTVSNPDIRDGKVVFTDSGTLWAHATPEPASLIGLLTLGASAGGITLLRRRRK
jgi:hypothetical protein